MSWAGERAKAFLLDANSASYLEHVEQAKESARQTQNRRNKVKYTTKRGDRIDLPEDTGSLRKKATHLYTQAVEAFDEVQAAVKRQAVIDEASGTVDERRFPSLPGGAA